MFSAFCHFVTLSFTFQTLLINIQAQNQIMPTEIDVAYCVTTQLQIEPGECISIQTQPSSDTFVPHDFIVQVRAIVHIMVKH